MPCYHKILAYQTHFGASLIFPKDKFGFPFDKYDKQKYKDIISNQKPGVFPRFLYVPCGQCIGCRLDYAHTWAVRCVLEQKFTLPDSCYFLSLTYEDEYVPKSIGSDVDLETGEVSQFFETLTLRYKDPKDFMKRLRINAWRRYGIENIRVYYCGEYGSITSRPHYHFILFNFAVPRSDLHLRREPSQTGYPLYNSDLVTDCWPFGFGVLGSLSYNSACYTAGYMIDKKKGLDSVQYEKLGVVPPKSFMSNRPGIARRFYDEHKDFIYENDCLGIAVGGKLVSPSPPKYFDSLYVQEHGDDSLIDLKSDRLQKVLDSEKKLQDILNMPIDMYWSKKFDCTLENVTRGRSRFL